MRRPVAAIANFDGLGRGDAPAWPEAVVFNAVSTYGGYRCCGAIKVQPLQLAEPAVVPGSAHTGTDVIQYRRQRFIPGDVKTQLIGRKPREARRRRNTKPAQQVGDHLCCRLQPDAGWFGAVDVGGHAALGIIGQRKGAGSQVGGVWNGHAVFTHSGNGLNSAVMHLVSFGGVVQQDWRHVKTSTEADRCWLASVRTRGNQCALQLPAQQFAAVAQCQLGSVITRCFQGISGGGDHNAKLHQRPARIATTDSDRQTADISCFQQTQQFVVQEQLDADTGRGAVAGEQFGQFATPATHRQNRVRIGCKGWRVIRARAVRVCCTANSLQLAGHPRLKFH